MLAKWRTRLLRKPLRSWTTLALHTRRTLAPLARSRHFQTGSSVRGFVRLAASAGSRVVNFANVILWILVVVVVVVGSVCLCLCLFLGSP